jgi:hypothetical protein
MPSKVARAVGVMAVCSAALAGLGCGKSCEDVTKDLATDLGKCSKTDLVETCQCMKSAYKKATDKNKCDNGIKRGWTSSLNKFCPNSE